MMLQVGLAVLTLLLNGGASAAEDPTNAAAFRAERDRRVSPDNPHGYQPIIDYNKPAIDPYTAELERQRHNNFRPNDQLIDLDKWFGRQR